MVGFAAHCLTALWGRSLTGPSGLRVLKFDTPYGVRVKVVPAAQFIVHFALLTSLGKHKNPSPRSKKQEPKNYYYQPTVPPQPTK